jgi:uncharacterized membrane protein
MLLSIGLAVSGLAMMPSELPLHTRLLTGWDIGIVSFLVLAYAVIWRADGEETYRTASHQDQSSAVIVAIVAGAASASLFAIGFLLGQAKGLSGTHRTLFLSISALTIVCSWFLTHTTFALHYAHRYYGGEKEEPVGEVNKGFTFPDNERPAYLDFVYVAFVIGMTAQVSDVEVTTRSMRNLVLRHSVLSFWFYAGILALAINLVSGLI